MQNTRMRDLLSTYGKQLLGSVTDLLPGQCQAVRGTCVGKDRSDDAEGKALREEMEGHFGQCTDFIRTAGKRMAEGEGRREESGGM